MGLSRRDFQSAMLGGILAPPANSPEEKPKPDDLFLALVRLQYPDERIKEAALDEILKDAAGMYARGIRLKEFPLTNGDAPASPFTIYRSDLAEIAERGAHGNSD